MTDDKPDKEGGKKAASDAASTASSAVAEASDAAAQVRVLARRGGREGREKWGPFPKFAACVVGRGWRCLCALQRAFLTFSCLSPALPRMP